MTNIENIGKPVYDGLDALKGLFSDDDCLVEHVITNTLFFDKKIVSSQARQVRSAIRKGEAIPVRYNSNGAFFLQHTVKATTPNFKNKSDAIKFTNLPDNYLFHKETKIRICFDRDGNYYPKRTIFDNTSHWVSSGQKSTVVNYIIAHIWNKTDNPLYFNLLWNFCLIPCHCAFLTDKHDDTNSVVKRVKNLIKAISLELYNPNHIMDWNQNVITENDFPTKESVSIARQFIKDGKIKCVRNFPVG